MKCRPGLLFLWALLFLPCCGNHTPVDAWPPGTSLKDLAIYVTNDIHYFAQSLHDQQTADQDGKNVEMVDFLLQALAYGLEKPAILLVNGDLSYNGERESHRELAARLQELAGQGVKVYVIPGNHDLNNPAARSLLKGRVALVQSVNPRQFVQVYRDFGYGEAISRDKTSLSYVAEPLPGLRLLMLDSCKYTNNRALGYSEVGGALAPATRAWIRKAAESARRDGAVLVAAMHHSLMDHHPLVHDGFTVDDAESLAELLTALGINFILTGHIHAQEIARAETSAGPVFDIATSALAVYPHQLGLLRYTPGSGAWQYSVFKPDMETWARSQGLTDARLLNFTSYTEGFFRRNAGDMVRRRLSPEQLSQLSPEEVDALAELMATLNSRYFAGTEALNALDIPQSAGYRLLETRELDFLTGYARTIMEDRPPANTELYIPIIRP
ncbi:MAG: metallophosphoesterase [Treponema sp.]|jgi:hypothetical protein|nr:metallophosphoesterase [Treponema sp.]